jgi:hypothetical protein
VAHPQRSRIFAAGVKFDRAPQRSRKRECGIVNVPAKAVTAPGAGDLARHSMWHDLLRDWNRWSVVERLLAILVIVGILLIQVPLIL